MRIRRQRGQAVMEMAILLPFFLLIIVGGIIDFGFAFNNYIALQQIAGDAARYCAEGRNGMCVSEPRIREFIFSRKPSWWDGNFIIPPIDETKSSDGLATIKKVYLVYDSPSYTPFYRSMFTAVSGTECIRLTVVAAWQVPRNIPSGVAPSTGER